MTYLEDEDHVSRVTQRECWNGRILSFLPGVALPGHKWAWLRAPGLDRVLAVQAEKKPSLGICLGMRAPVV